MEWKYLYTITDDASVIVATGGLISGSLGTDILCLPDGCYDITVGGGSWPTEVSFDFASLVGVGVGTYTSISIGGAFCPVDGCTDPTACNYDATANVDDGSCDYNSGNTNLAANDWYMYNPSGTSEYIVTFDNSTLTYNMSFTDPQSNWSGTGSFIFCGDSLIMDSIFADVGSSSWPGYNFSYLSSTGGFTGVYAGSTPYAMIPAVYGCTDPTACNYDATANVDDGSCDYNSGNTNLAANDWYMYNPSGTSEYIVTFDNSTLTYNMSFTDPQSNWSGTGSFIFCGDSLIMDSIFADVGSSSWPGYNFSYLSSTGGFTGVYAGSTPYAMIPAVYGCTDPTACNYDATANVDDGSCYGGNTNLAVNDWYLYDLANPWEYIVTFDNSTLIYNMSLTDPQSNWSGTGSYTFCGDSLIMDSVFYVWTSSVAPGFNFSYLSSTGGFIGVYAGSTPYAMIPAVYGCTDPNAANYDSFANIDDGNCNYCSSLFVTTIITDVTCNGVNDGAASVFVSGGTPPYIYLWSNGQTTQNATGLSAGLYTCDIIDANNCVITDNVTISEPSPIASTTFSTDLLCFGDATGTAHLSVTGGIPPYTYLWSDGQVTQNATGLSAGLYTCDIIDANGCPLTDNVTVLQPSPLVATPFVVTEPTCPNTCDGELTVFSSGGTGSHSYTINGSSSSIFLNACVDWYHYIVTDSSNCVVHDSIYLSSSGIFGCTDLTATNYDPAATCDDGSCTYPAPMVNLFFSEYAEGSSNNKYLEIYNPSLVTVDLSDYAYANVSNDPSTPGVYEYWNDFDAGASIAPGDVYVIAHPSVDPAILAVADETHSYLSNGDDGYALVYGSNPGSPVDPATGGYIILDFIGDWNGDPGSGWSVAGVSDATKDHTLVRKCDVTQGNDDWVASAGTNTTDSEWEVLPQNDWSNLHSHTTPCASVSGCTDPAACNYDPLATIDDGSCISTTPTSHVINAGMYYYVPTNLTINVGDTVTWINDAGYHDVNGDVNSLTGVSYNNPESFYLPPTSGPSTIGSYVFTVAGSYTYDCSIGSHAANGMIGFIDVNLIPLGCTDLTATNYDPSALCDDGSCTYDVFGCTDPTATNYDPLATQDDGSCTYPPAAMVNLFFSEYAEGSSNNKYLEIYNPSLVTVDLSDYAYANVSNDPSTPGVYEYWNDFDAGASIAPGDVYVIAHPSADPAILAVADETHSYLSNGDDGYALVYGSNPGSPVDPATGGYIILDFIGDWNGDPGSGWSVAGVSDATKDHTLVRKCDVTQGNDDWVASAGTNTTDSEWEVLPQNDWSNLHSHTTPCASVSGCTDPAACNYDASANVDDGSCLTTYGCTDPTQFNYDPAATCDDGSCVPFTGGCTDSAAANYNPSANTDDGSCLYPDVLIHQQVIMIQTLT